MSGRAVFLLALVAPSAAAAHASERMVILTLPTGWYMAGAAVAVAATALIGALAPQLPAPAALTLLRRPILVPRVATSTAAAAALAGLVLTGWFGSRDPLANLLPLTVWTLVWVGVPLASLVFGNVWRDVEPWTGPVRLARRALGRTGGIGLRRLGFWPAVAGLLGFAWFEIVSLRPADPAVLAWVVAAYWAAIFVAGVLEGERWLAQGEFLTVSFGLIARVAPLWAERDGHRLAIRAGWPGTRVLAMAPLPAGGIAVVTLLLASLSFDGLSETFWWLARLGINPLEFPGRSAVIGANTAGLLAAWLLTAAAILGTFALQRRLAGRPEGLLACAGRWILAFVPIAAGYHAAHYLVALLTDGQYAIVALGDPVGRGWNPFGLPEHWVSFAFLADPAGARTVWQIQVALIVGAHVLAVLLGLALAAGGRPAAPRSHLPMTALMVAYTVFGLWLLASPTGT